MKIVVPDASVILKWVVPDPQGEQDVAQALGLRDAAISGKISIEVPTLWLYEVGNTLTRRFAEHAQNVLAALTAFGLTERRIEGELLNRAVALTQSHGVTFYDASYHALALAKQGVFVTADVRYVRKAAGAGAVVSLKEWA